LIEQGFILIFKYKTNRYPVITGVGVINSSTGRKISSLQICAAGLWQQI